MIPTLHRIARHLAAVVACGLPLAAQCCLGAQDVTATSCDGRYRVEAISCTGTGPSSHGPYRFAFHSLHVGADGKAQPIGTFERSWDSHAHFTMQLFVSPTGNGFLLSTSLEEDLLFLSPTGAELRRIHGAHGQGIARHNHLTTDPLALLLFADGGARRTQLWLPLCQLLGPEEQRTGKVVAIAAANYEPIAGAPWWTPPGDERAWLRRMLHWSPAQGERERDAMQHAVARFAADVVDAAAGTEVAAARRELVDLGLSAVAALQQARATQPAAQQRIDALLATFTSWTCGHEQPWRNLDLLAALLGHPDPELAADARSQLLAVLPRSAEPTAAWVAAHRSTLRWDAAASRYAD